MDRNAVVTQVGRNHEGKTIFKVVVDGYNLDLYLVDANTSTYNWRDGKPGNNHPENMPPTPEPVMHSTVAPFAPSADWIEWYKTQNGCTGLEAYEEGKRCISLQREQ